MSDTPSTDHADALREVQGWMALDLHQALGHPVNPIAKYEGHRSWGDWWAVLIADVRRLARPQHEQPLAVGDVLHGFCGGAFGRDHYACSRVESLGPDWVVVRGGDEDARIGFAVGPFDRLAEYRAETDYCSSHPCPVQPEGRRP